MDFIIKEFVHDQMATYGILAAAEKSIDTTLFVFGNTSELKLNPLIYILIVQLKRFGNINLNGCIEKQKYLCS